MQCRENFIETKIFNELINDLDHTLSFNSASADHFLKAKCQGKLPTLAEMDQHLGAYRKTHPNTYQLKGITFTDEHPQMISHFEKLTKNLSDQSSIMKVASSDCKKVICAMNIVFGKPQTIRMLYLLDKYDLNTSHHAFENKDPWSFNQLDLINRTMSDLPDFLIPYTQNHECSRHPKGSLLSDDETVLANSTMTFSDSWEEQNEQQKALTIIHEVGHNIGHHNNMDTSEEWKAFSGWKFVDEKWVATKPEALTSLYSEKNPREDFAESFVAYRYNPHLLEQRSPEKYQYLKKNVFQGIEYKDESQCKNNLSQSRKLNLDPMYQLKEADMKYCIPEILDLYRFYLSDQALKKCLLKANFQKQLEIDPSLEKSQRDGIKLNQGLHLQQVIDIPLSHLNSQRELLNNIAATYAYDSYQKSHFKKDCKTLKEYGYFEFEIIETFQDDPIYNMKNKYSFGEVLDYICQQKIINSNFSLEDLKKYLKNK